ncbi:alkaline phosphatase family protein [Aneurinibacillus tyrosinisolvens]|uniref:alkaline phosphatase family protein n=1 Tax=Aneurinibacillus tyrosinisolvens TaxID=1443435 RepID=UPI001F3A3379|nr:alkaline phosphatase family protein [Aneurinibacillus tyrosinisolvens]
MHLPLQEAIRKGRAPALRFFMERGQYIPDVVSSFPTMSVTVDSSLLTGTYPDRHRVPGLVWYDETEKRIVNYGNGKRELLKIGIKQILLDNLYRLNNEHLSQDVQMIHEELAFHKIPSGSINGLIYHGSFLQPFNVPKLTVWLKLLPEKLRTHGPLLFSFGVLACLYSENRY